MNEIPDYSRISADIITLMLEGMSLQVLESMTTETNFPHFCRAAMKMNDNGNYFPLLGICLGMQEMTTWPLNPRVTPMSNTTGTEGVSLPLNFTSEAGHSRLYGNMPPDLIKILVQESVTPNYHHYGLPWTRYKSDKALSSFYMTTTTNVDMKGLTFVSSIEARKYPFYGVQWHPEKINFWFTANGRINHSRNAVRVSQYVSNFLADEAKKSKQAFKSILEQSRFLFDNYPVILSRKDLHTAYCFDDTDVPHFDG